MDGESAAEATEAATSAPCRTPRFVSSSASSKLVGILNAPRADRLDAPSTIQPCPRCFLKQGLPGPPWAKVSHEAGSQASKGCPCCSGDCATCLASWAGARRVRENKLRACVPRCRCASPNNGGKVPSRSVDTRVRSADCRAPTLVPTLVPTHRGVAVNVPMGRVSK